MTGFLEIIIKDLQERFKHLGVGSVAAAYPDLKPPWYSMSQPRQHHAIEAFRKDCNVSLAHRLRVRGHFKQMSSPVQQQWNHGNLLQPVDTLQVYSLCSKGYLSYMPHLFNKDAETEARVRHRPGDGARPKWGVDVDSQLSTGLIPSVDSGLALAASKL